MFKTHITLTLRWAIRDRLLHAVLGSAGLLLLLIPAFSLFSMRQVQELATSLCFSLLAMILLILVLLLGGFSLWREVDRRYTASVLTLPMPRSQFVLGRYVGIVLFLTLATLCLAGVSVLVILAARSFYPSDLPPQWMLMLIAIVGLWGKFVLLAAVAVLFSSLSTSFFLPFFGTLAVYIAGSASQQVYDYISGSYGERLTASALWVIKGAYYLVPNLSVFDFQLQAIYGLPVVYGNLWLVPLYLIVYVALCLWLAITIFSRRQFS